LNASITLLLALLAAAATRGDEAELEWRFAAAVDGKRLLRTVRELTALGARMGGTESGDAAAKYHAARFRAAGLEPVPTVDPELRAFQPNKLVANLVIADATIELKDGALALHTPGIGRTTLPLLLEPPASAGDAPSSPYALLVDAPTHGEQGPTAAAKASAAFAGVTRLPRSARPRVVLVAFDQRVESSTPVLHHGRDFEGTVLTISRREAASLRAACAEAPEADPELSIEAEVFDGPGHPITVLADVPGTAPAAGSGPPILLFCAHGDSDSGSLGADDNASGDAVVHELAAVFAQLRDDAKDGKGGMALPITLRFVVWGSEIHSTNNYIARTRGDGSLARHVAVVNFDQAGTGAERDCIYFEPDDLPLNQPLVRLGLDVAQERVGRDGFWSEYTSNAALGGTDSYCFSPGWRQGGAKGDLPAITIFSAAFGEAERTRVTEGFLSPGWKGEHDRIVVDYSKVYHETGDRPDVTTEAEPWNMEWVTKAAGLLALRLASSPETVKKLLDR